MGLQELEISKFTQDSDLKTNCVGSPTHRTALTIGEAAQIITIATGKSSIEVFNNSDNTIYYGGTGVTTGDGIPIFGNSSKIWQNVVSAFTVYLISSAEATELRIADYE